MALSATTGHINYCINVFRITFSEQHDKPSYTPIASATLEVIALRIPSVNIFVLNF